MAQVRNKKGIALYVPELNRTVEADQVVEIPDDRLEAFASQTETWSDETVAAPEKKAKTN